MNSADMIIAFLVQYRLTFLVVHILSMAIGLGGATVSDVLFFRFLKDFRISKKEQEVMHILKNLILSMMLVIIVSGFAVYLPEADRLNASHMFFVKVIIATVLFLNGIALHVFIAPYLIRLNLRKQHYMGKAWHSLAFALGAISICSWYSVFLIAMLKKSLPFNFSTMMISYLLLLLCAVTASQLLRLFLSKKAATHVH